MELLLKMRMMVQLLEQKSSQGNSIKGQLDEALYVLLEGAPKIHFKKHKKLQNIQRKRCI